MINDSIGETFGYGRVSTSDQCAENQRLEIEAAGFKIKQMYWYSDCVSGKVPACQRPQFATLKNKIRAGETLVVSKLDRLGRDSLDVMATLRDLEAMEIRVVVLQLGKTDLSSPAGKLLITMLSAVAEMERDLLVERIHAGLSRARASGIKMGRRSKTSDAQKIEIREKLAKGATVSALSRAYRISRGTVINIRGNR